MLAPSRRRRCENWRKRIGIYIRLRAPELVLVFDNFSTTTAYHLHLLALVAYYLACPSVTIRKTRARLNTARSRHRKTTLTRFAILTKLGTTRITAATKLLQTEVELTGRLVITSRGASRTESAFDSPSTEDWPMRGHCAIMSE